MQKLAINELSRLIAPKETQFLYDYLAKKSYSTDDRATLAAIIDPDETTPAISDAGLKKALSSYLTELYRLRILAAQKIAQGMAQVISQPINQQPDLETMFPHELSNRIQGIPFSRSEIAQRIQCQDSNPILQQKTAWLIKKITNLETPEKWIKDLLLAVTARYDVTADTKIIITPGDNGDPVCQAHTCFNQLEVPTIHTSFGSGETIPLTEQEMFFNNLQLLIAVRKDFQAM